MPKYEVIIYRGSIYYEIDAFDEEEAAEKGWDKFKEEYPEESRSAEIGDVELIEED